MLLALGAGAGLRLRRARLRAPVPALPPVEDADAVEAELQEILAEARARVPAGASPLTAAPHEPADRSLPRG
ncbi:MAG: hypothetical protein M3P39_01985 [Actinomycetota bacterium]|nr:hypothetical protein [Actinomycetota bacterium]